VAKTSDEQKAEEKEGKPRRGFTTTTVYAAFGFLTALVSFVFLVNPAWRPDPRDRQIADLTTPAVDVGIPFGAYIERVGDVNRMRDKKALCIPGNVVYIKVSLQGFKHRDTTLRWVTMNAVTNRRVESRGEVLLRGQAPSDQGVSLVWVQWPLRHDVRKYVIRFLLRSDDDLLAVADTPEFRVTQDRYVRLYNRCLDDVETGKPLEGDGPLEASLGGGGGFDVGRWLLFAAVAVTAGLLAALAFHGATGLLRRRRHE
jgi:hypothetical protein